MRLLVLIVGLAVLVLNAHGSLELLSAQEGRQRVAQAEKNRQAGNRFLDSLGGSKVLNVGLAAAIEKLGQVGGCLLIGETLKPEWDAVSAYQGISLRNGKWRCTLDAELRRAEFVLETDQEYQPCLVFEIVRHKLVFKEASLKQVALVPL